MDVDAMGRDVIVGDVLWDHEDFTCARVQSLYGEVSVAEMDDGCDYSVGRFYRVPRPGEAFPREFPEKSRLIQRMVSEGGKVLHSPDYADAMRQSACTWMRPLDSGVYYMLYPIQTSLEQYATLEAAQAAALAMSEHYRGESFDVLQCVWNTKMRQNRE